MTSRQIAALFCVLVMYRMWMASLWESYQRPRAGSASGDRVTILCIADSYGVHYDMRLPQADVLVLAGGVLAPPPAKADPRAHAEAEVLRLDAWLGAQQARFRERVVLLGSGDFPPESGELGIPDGSQGSGGTTGAPLKLQNGTLLQDSTFKSVAGLKFWGAAWQPQSASSSFYLPRGSRALQARWRQMPEGIDVLVTRTPPLSAGDHRPSRGMGSGTGVLPPSEALAAELKLMQLLGGGADPRTSAGDWDLGGGLSPLYNNVTVKDRGTPLTDATRRLAEDALVNWGCGLLRHRIGEVKPRLHIFGRTPAGYGVTSGRQIHFVNSALSTPQRVLTHSGQARLLRFPDQSFRPRKPVLWSVARPRSKDFLTRKDREVPFAIQ